MAKTHHYELTVTWTGNTGTGYQRISGIRAFARRQPHAGKPTDSRER